MGNIFYSIFIIKLCVSLCLSQEVQQATVKPQSYTTTETYSSEPDVYNCYAQKKSCEDSSNFEPKPTCVFAKYRGLTNYLGVCAVYLQNCVIMHEKKYKDGYASLDDEIYYNGLYFDCQYYGQHAKSEKQAIQWYFKLGGLDAENQLCHGRKVKVKAKEKKFDKADKIAEGKKPKKKTNQYSMDTIIEVPPPPIVTMGTAMVFEAVDYTLLPTEIYKHYVDCYYIHTKCVRDRVNFESVCGYHGVFYRILFTNQCELDLQNCNQRMINNQGLYANKSLDPDADIMRTYIYHGDTTDCYAVTRRFNVPDDRVNFYYEEELKAFEENMLNYNVNISDNNY